MSNEKVYTHGTLIGGKRRISRRQMLKLSGMAAASASLSLSTVAAEPHGEARRHPGRSFDYRIILGWINDNSSRPLVGKRWPIVDVDEADQTQWLAATLPGHELQRLSEWHAVSVLRFADGWRGAIT
jgi:hypothetical protein